MAHVSVLLNETIELLDPKEGDVILDGTLGSAGHAIEICKRIGKSGILIGMDQDAEMLKVAKKNMEESGCSCKKIFINDNFRNLDECLADLKNKKVYSAEKGINGVLFDLGLNSRQLEESGRGFTFQKDEPLLMTFNPNPGEDDLTAMEIVNSWNEKEIADVIFKYGEERFSRKIAKGIVERRKKEKIKTTFDLVDVIRASVPSFYRNPSVRFGQANRRTNCCTRTFQALRIAVNDEMGVLEDGLKKAWNELGVNGRLVVISFHSLEDRMVKVFFKELAEMGEANPAFAKEGYGEANPAFAKSYGEAKGKVLTKKPIVASEEEVQENPRSRSAKLRGIVKLV